MSEAFCVDWSSVLTKQSLGATVWINLFNFEVTASLKLLSWEQT